MQHCNYVVFLETTTQERHARVAQRALARTDKLKVDDAIMAAGDLEDRSWIEPNRRGNDIVIDNNDYNNPVILTY